MLNAALQGDARQPAHGIVGGNSVEMLVNAPNFLKDLQVDLAPLGKGDHVDMTMFAFRPTGSGRIVADMLEAAAGRGAEITVMVDAVGTKTRTDPAAAAMLDEMRGNGIDVKVNPSSMKGSLSGPRKGEAHIDHRKLYSINNRVAYLGGQNLGEEFDNWHDAMMRLEGPAAAQVGAELVGRYVDLGGTVSAGRQASLAGALNNPKAAGTASVQVFANSPGSDKPATEHLLGSIKDAKSRIWLASQWIGDKEVAHEMEAAKARGVDVRIMTPSPKANAINPAIPLGHMFYRDLTKAGVKVYEWPGMVHAKWWLIDDASHIGSYNLDRFSRGKHYELQAKVQDAQFTQQMSDQLTDDFTHSKLLTSADVDKLGSRLGQAVQRTTGATF